MDYLLLILVLDLLAMNKNLCCTLPEIRFGSQSARLLLLTLGSLP